MSQSLFIHGQDLKLEVSWGRRGSRFPPLDCFCLDDVDLLASSDSKRALGGFDGKVKYYENCNWPRGFQ